MSKKMVGVAIKVITTVHQFCIRTKNSSARSFSSRTNWRSWLQQNIIKTAICGYTMNNIYEASITWKKKLEINSWSAFSMTWIRKNFLFVGWKKIFFQKKNSYAGSFESVLWWNSCEVGGKIIFYTMNKKKVWWNLLK